MLFHAISVYSETSAAAAISSAMGEAYADYGKDAQSVHIIVSSVFQVDDGWKAIVRVIVEPDLEEKLELNLKYEEYHEAKKDKKQEENFDIDLDISVEFSPDDVLEISALSHFVNDLNHLHLAPASDTITNEPDSLVIGVLHDGPSNEYTHKPVSAERNLDVEVFYNVDNRGASLDRSANQKVKESLDELRVNPLNNQESDVNAFTYLYIPSNYTEVYSELVLTNTHVHIHLIEEGPLWNNIQDYLLDIQFYEATHLYELEKKHEADSRQFQENMKSPEPKQRRKELLEDLELR